MAKNFDWSKEQTDKVFEKLLRDELRLLNKTVRDPDVYKSVVAEMVKKIDEKKPLFDGERDTFRK